MSFVIGEHSSIHLYSYPTCIYAHCLKIILTEKDVGYKHDVMNKNEKFSEDFCTINPEEKIPFFVDRDLYLSNVLVICEYLDERFPHPPLMSVEPAMRARYRSALIYVHDHLYRVFMRTQSINKKTVKAACKELHAGIIEYAEAFSGSKYIMMDEFGLLDCLFIPLLWRLKSINIRMTHKGILKYQERMFVHPSFRYSISEEELDLDI